MFYLFFKWIAVSVTLHVLYFVVIRRKYCSCTAMSESSVFPGDQKERKLGLLNMLKFLALILVPTIQTTVFSRSIFTPRVFDHSSTVLAVCVALSGCFKTTIIKLRPRLALVVHSQYHESTYSTMAYQKSFASVIAIGTWCCLPTGDGFCVVHSRIFWYSENDMSTLIHRYINKLRCRSFRSWAESDSPAEFHKTDT